MSAILLSLACAAASSLERRFTSSPTWSSASSAPTVLRVDAAATDAARGGRPGPRLAAGAAGGIDAEADFGGRPGPRLPATGGGGGGGAGGRGGRATGSRLGRGGGGGH